MDRNRILDLLRKTSEPNQAIRESAERELDSIYKIIGFTPTLLEIALDKQLEVHVRQAAIIYLKNNVTKFWESSQSCVSENGLIDPNQFTIHELDKQLVTNSIVDAITDCDTDLISIHLSSIISFVIKSDFPHKWPGVVDKIHHYLANSNDFKAKSGALLTFFQLAKVYEFKNQTERKPFVDALKILLPDACLCITQVLQNDPLSEFSCRIQKHILKTLHVILQYSLPLAVLDRDTFATWMALILEIAKRDVPEEVQKDVDPEDRPDLVWWKCKKWSIHLLARIFERYGSPNNVNKEYKSFAEWYIANFSYPVIQTIIKILEHYALGQYVSPRVMQQALHYLNTAVLHSMTWKILKTDMLVVVEKIIFPLMCHSSDDEKLWHEDPREYIRMKYDIFEEYVSPVSASQTLLHSLCKKRKGMLQKTMTLVVNVLNNPQADPKAKDGALHMVGSISSVLLKKPHFKDQLEQLLVTYVFPLFTSTYGFLRARACWVLNYFAAIEFKNVNNIVLATQSVLQCILVDQELPVKVEAAMCLQGLLHVVEQAREVTKPNVKPLTLELVQLIRNTESEDVLEVLQKIVFLYPQELYVIAAEMTQHLAQTFHQLIQGSDSDDDDKISAAMAVLGTIDTVLTMMDEQKDVVAKLEPIVVNIIVTIFEQSTKELYEEATTLLSTITADAVSSESWRVFQTLYAVFKRDGFDYFTDMMSPIHNYITVDPQTFLSNRSNLGAVYEMCQTILTDPNGNEDMETYAAKLLEIVILQFVNQINDCIPSFVELAITRLRRKTMSAELRTLLIQIVIAAFYSNDQLLFSIFEKLEEQGGQPKYALFESFVKQWLADIDELMGLHDRKMSVIGFCKLMLLPAERRPPILFQIANQIIPLCITLCKKLEIAYQRKASAVSESDSDDDEEEEDDSDTEAEVLEDDQDHVGQQAKNDDDDDDEFEDIAEGVDLSDTDDCDESDPDYDCEITALESFETLIDIEKGFVDEFILFRDTIEATRTSDPNWYQLLVGSLDANQQKALTGICQHATNRQTERANQPRPQ